MKIFNNYEIEYSLEIFRKFLDTRPGIHDVCVRPLYDSESTLSYIEVNLRHDDDIFESTIKCSVGLILKENLMDLNALEYERIKNGKLLIFTRI